MALLPREKKSKIIVLNGNTGATSTDGVGVDTYINISDLNAQSVRIRNAYCIDGNVSLPLPFISGSSRISVYSNNTKITIFNSLKYYNNKPIEILLEYK